MFCTVSTFGYVLLFLIIGLLFVVITLGIGKFIRPYHPNASKNSTYECGEETIEGDWGKFTIRFYLIALIFVLFEVEIIFLFPWAKVFSDTVLLASQTNWKIWAFIEGSLFILILVIGLVYLWRQNILTWQVNKPTSQQRIIPAENEENKPISTNIYQQINQRYQ